LFQFFECLIYDFLQEEVAFLKQRDDEAQTEIESLLKKLEIAEKEKQEALKEVKEKQQSWDVEKGSMTFKVKSTESVSNTLRDSLSKAGDRIQELETLLKKEGKDVLFHKLFLKKKNCQIRLHLLVQALKQF